MSSRNPEMQGGRSGCAVGKLGGSAAFGVLCVVICAGAVFGAGRMSRIGSGQAAERKGPEAGARDSGEIETKQITIHAPKALRSGKKVSLVVPAGELKDGDAAGLCAKAAGLMGEDFDRKKVDELLGKAMQELREEELRPILDRYDGALRAVSEAARCRSCGKPWGAGEEAPGSLTKLRNLTLILGLKVRSQLLRGDYEGAAGTLQTGFALGRHMGQGPTLVHGLVGVAICARMCGEVEVFIGQRGAPSLLAGLEGLPRPLVDLTEKLESEMGFVGGADREQIESLQARLDRHVAALRCIEGVRAYMGEKGWLPGSLEQAGPSANVTDSVTGRPFVYRRSGGKATIEGPIPEGGRAKEAISYELVQSGGT